MDGGDDGDSDGEVPPLEHRAHFDIDVDEGYVHIEQSWGDRTLYTPEEARELAEEIATAADQAVGVD
ncbi:MAG: hypothetical protein V5A43_00060 [Haloarculaceae archaeon]